jgi:hypothetical protein
MTRCTRSRPAVQSFCRSQDPRAAKSGPVLAGSALAARGSCPVFQETVRQPYEEATTDTSCWLARRGFQRPLRYGTNVQVGTRRGACGQFGLAPSSSTAPLPCRLPVSAVRGLAGCLVGAVSRRSGVVQPVSAVRGLAGCLVGAVSRRSGVVQPVSAVRGWPGASSGGLPAVGVVQPRVCGSGWPRAALARQDRC